MSNETLVKCKDHLRIDLYLFQCILGTGARPRNRAQIPLVICFDRQKFIQSVKLHISHQLKPYLFVKAIRGQSFNCFRVFGALGYFWETGLKLSLYTPNHGQENTESNAKSSTFHFTSHEALLKCNDHVRVKFHMLQGICGNRAIWGNQAPVP